MATRARYDEEAPVWRSARGRDDGRRITREQARALDRAALTELGIPGLVLMEHAARSVAELVTELRTPPGRALIVCGGGNNGGDGFVIARMLRDAGFDVFVVASSSASRMRGDASIERAIAARAGVRIETIEALRSVTIEERGEARAGEHTDVAAVTSTLARIEQRLGGPPDVIVDALLGTGFVGALRDDAAFLIELVNQAGARAGTLVVAVDLPSGIDADSGAAAPRSPSAAVGARVSAVRAHVTATFVARKLGFDAAEAAPYLGRVVVLPIGATRELVERFTRPRGS